MDHRFKSYLEAINLILIAKLIGGERKIVLIFELLIKGFQIDKKPRKILGRKALFRFD